ncbi:MAG TPA: glycoside hydrolase family 43 protein [Chryseosolibacter sp.]|nr:glycoside hydrolase family 43 protein [Chryseosolibacter sp.]
MTYFMEELVFCYFKGHGDGLHLATSTDGYRWRAINNDAPVLRPLIGVECIMRDPCVIYGMDGNYHLVWTVGWNERGIGYAHSQDLIRWSSQEYLPVMEHVENARNCWAPEIFFYEKAEVYIIHWSSTIDGHFPETQPYGDDGYNHRLYYVLTKDFRTFSETKLLYDGGFNSIDGNIIKADDGYLLFLKNETLMPPQKNIRFASGLSPFSFGKASEPITSQHYWAEGPSAIKLNNEWLVYFDKYKVNQLGLVRSIDLKHWEDASDELEFPEGAQHGSVVRSPYNVIANLINHYG